MNRHFASVVGAFLGCFAAGSLWRIVMTRLATDPRTGEYMERRTKEGRSKREVIRILKRYVAHEVFKHLPRN